MFKKKHLLFTTLYLGISYLTPLIANNPLSPQTPVAITTNGQVGSAVVVSGNSAGFMAAWSDNNNLTTSFYDNKNPTWSQPEYIDLAGMISISSNESGFLIVTNPVSPGSTPPIVSQFYNITTKNWTEPVEIDDEAQFLATAATEDGFIAVWYNPTDDKLYSSFSSDGTQWNASSTISSGDNLRVPSVSATAAGFMATWKGSPDYNSDSPAFSSNNGTTWSTRQSVEEETAGLVVSGNQDGFMIVWKDGSDEVYSIFSKDKGITWTSPVKIASNLSLFSTPQISSTNAGFVVTWYDGISITSASFSSDQGNTWSTPVFITNDIGDGGINVSAFRDKCMFTWQSSLGNAFSSLSSFPIPGPAPNPTTKPNLAEAAKIFSPIKPQK